ncbi:TetR/AcrR family transcriptional regulator [Pseudonocardia sp. GCM10023141]|uniref:TetR/AcrR family transcriptional regulator n=1 Tax=Pseudonocardia sp. GCM10023141 TaxID=3252653 RepID=UPI00361CBC71
MTVQSRRERERAERHQLIIDTARGLAESEGWEAVTTRRLAALIEYSQPVLYSHFAGKDAIMAAVALAGFGELAAELREIRAGIPDAAQAFAGLAAAYLAFADAKPARYDAMFVLTTDLAFASSETPQPLLDAFDALCEFAAPVAAGRDVAALTELFWAALHGLVTLERSGRVPAAQRRDRLRMLVAQFLAVP